MKYAVKNYLLLVFICCASMKCQEPEIDNFTPPPSTPSVDVPIVEAYFTNGNQSMLLQQSEEAIKGFDSNADNQITIDASTRYQSMDGFGFALTGGSALHLQKMSASARNNLLEELFGNDKGELGMSMLRISIAASDLDVSVFSYNDLPEGKTDVNLEQFSIEPDRVNLIPMLKEILAINPYIKIMASSWSAPAWMKTSQSSVGGRLKQEFYGSYAQYFLKYLEAMKAEGIDIDYITVQNEPLHDGNNPSMYMTAIEQAAFIGQYLGPLFEERQINTKIIAYDHNADKPEYPLSVMGDSDANKYVAGSAFHLYAGNINSLSTVHNQYPDKEVHFSEQWFGAPGNFEGDLKWHIENVVIGSIRNWSQSVIEWNLSSAPDLRPFTNGGCNACLGGITIDGDNIVRNAGYYVIGHLSQFVPPASIRVASNNHQLSNVAFITPDNEVVLVALNNGESQRLLNVAQNDTKFAVEIAPNTVATFRWKLN